jgi:glucose/arabinose dehydrogenase
MFHSILNGQTVVRTTILLVLLGMVGLTTGHTFISGVFGGQPAQALPLTPPEFLNVSLVNVADGFDQPTVITHAGDGRLFVAEQAGQIRLIDDGGTVLPDPFLDIQALVTTGFYEQGLLGMTFHPDYAANGYFFVYYTGLDNASNIVRYSVDPGDPNLADPSSAFPILVVPQPQQNNNGGDLHFGPDGYLYVALGDGGAMGDPDDQAQDGSSLLGKILRLDVDGISGTTNYLIPPDNPFVADPAVRDEIWALGLRNPWRFSFDQATGDMYIADVGLGASEEINFQPAGSPGGENYGWRCYEGNEPHNLDGCGPHQAYTVPIHAYPHYQGSTFLGCSVTGGFVYRGSWSAALIGHYIFADYCSGNFWALSPDGDSGWSVIFLGQLLNNVSALGEGANGELYAAGHANGTISRLKAQPTTPDVSLSPFASGFSNPIGIVNSGLAGDGRLFIVQQGGLIRILQSDGSLRPTPFLSLVGQVSGASEQGLLGLVFHPEYASNGYFYVNYTNLSGNTVIARYTVSGSDPHVADPASQLILLTVNQPAANHNGGDLHFGPDGYLYIGLGDGGPSIYGQDMASLLGKMLRIDVDPTAGLSPDCGSGGNYSIPSDNPLRDGPGGTCDEIWASGLRNPWRFSFDRHLGDMYIADVGQNQWEEINRQAAGSAGGQNYGWRCYEGNAPYNLTDCAPIGSYTFPIFDYSHAGSNCSVTGGYVYRGSQYPALWGHYLLADYCSGRFWALHPDGDGGWQSVVLGQLLSTWSASSFGENVAGELFVSHRGNGTIYRVQEDTPPPPTATPTPTSTPVGTPTVTPTATPMPEFDWFSYLPLVTAEEAEEQNATPTPETGD